MPEASLAALHRPMDSLPDSPRNWLIQTAVRKVTDQISPQRPIAGRPDHPANLPEQRYLIAQATRLSD